MQMDAKRLNNRRLEKNQFFECYLSIFNFFYLSPILDLLSYSGHLPCETSRPNKVPIPQHREVRFALLTSEL